MVMYMSKFRKICKFNDEGIIKFKNLIVNNHNYIKTMNEIEHLCEDENYVENISEKSISNTFTHKFEAAEKIIEAKEYIKDFSYENIGLWSWLSAHMMPSLAPKNIRKYYVFIPDGDYRYRARHILRSSCSMYEMYRVKSKSLLNSSPIEVWGDILEQFGYTSSKEELSNDLIIDFINSVYIDEETKEIKKGVAGGGKNERPGSIRRFKKLIAELNLTYNLREMNYEEFVKLLPNEYNKFLYSDEIKNNNRKLAIIVSYFLSRFNEEAYEVLNLGSMNSTHSEIGKKLNVPGNTIKNIREQFDPYHDNNRVGWYQRDLSISRKEVLNVFKSKSFKFMHKIVLQILDNSKEEDYEEIIKKSKKKSFFNL